MTATADLSDAFLQAAIAMCGRLECHPLDLLGCWMNESGVSSVAQNKSAFAAGIFQAMPSTLRGMAFRGDEKYREPPGAYVAAQQAIMLAKAHNDAHGADAARIELRGLDKALSNAFTRLTPEQQLPWAHRYYLPRRGQLIDPAACYMATFCPAWIGHASDPTWVICARDGVGDSPLSVSESEEWYRENSGLDVDGDGRITPGDLEAAIRRATKGARWEEITARVNAIAVPSPPPTIPEILASTGECTEEGDG